MDILSSSISFSFSFILSQTHPKPETNLNHALLPIIVVDPSAGTFASFYYKNIRDFDTPTKDHIVAFGQDERFTVGAFDVSFPSMYSLIIGIFKF